MTRILLIRHAAADLIAEVLYGRTPGLHLNSAGQRQAQLLAQALKTRYKIDAIISSPLERALETATPVAELQSSGVSIDDGLTEIDFGAWVGKPLSELRGLDEWKQYNRRRSLSCPPGGETLMAVQARGWASLRAAADGCGSDATIAVVTHGDVIRALLILLLGMPLDHIMRIEIAPASVTEITMAAEPVIQNMNQVFW